MALRGTGDRYGNLAIALHWIAALAILVQLGLGFAVAGAADGLHRAALLRVHAPLGVLVLLLTAIRVLWWLFDRRPGAPAGLPRWQLRAAGFVHRLLLLVTALAAVSGMGLLVRSGANKVIFGGSPGPLPDFTPFFQLYVHRTAVILLVALLCLHLGAALHHHFFRHNRLFARIGIGAP